MAVPGFVPIYSGGTARELHPLPVLWSYTGSTIGEGSKTCQAQLEPQRLIPLLRTILFLLMNVHLVLVTIHEAVVVSPDFHQVHFVKKENDRGMDV